MWTDFYSLYAHQLAWVGQGLIPYKDFDFTYPPLFLYALVPFFAVGGAQASSLPIVLTDALVAPLVYGLGRTLSGEKNAFLSAVAYALLPIALVNEGYLWLSSEPMLFFMLLGIFMMYKKRYWPSAISLGIAILFKQQALFALPAVLYYMFRGEGIRAWKPIAILVAVVSLTSLPFLILTPVRYVWMVSYGVVNLGFHPVMVQLNSTFVASTEICNSALTSAPTYACLAIPTPLITAFFNALGWVSQILALPLVAITLVGLASSKNRDEEIGMLFAWSSLACLAVFSSFVFQVYPYYIIPVYALLLPSAKSKLNIASVAFLSTLAMISPTGSTQIFLAGSCLLISIALEDHILSSGATAPPKPGLSPVRGTSVKSPGRFWQ